MTTKLQFIAMKTNNYTSRIIKKSICSLKFLFIAAIFLVIVNVNTVFAACTPPTTQAKNITFSGITSSQRTVTWQRGNGTGGVLVTARLTSTVAQVDPFSGMTYTANASFGSCSSATNSTCITGIGCYVVYIGTSTSVTVTGLACSTGYTFTVYEYNTTGTCYLTPGLSASDTQASNVNFTTIATSTSTPTTVNWTRGSGDNVLVVARLTSTTPVDPVNGTAYNSPSTVFGSGSQIAGTNNYVVFKGTGTSVAVTNLAASTGYTFTVYEFFNSGTCYLTPGVSAAASYTPSTAICTNGGTTSLSPPTFYPATGGTTYASGNNYYNIFTSSGTFNALSGINIAEVLVVAGGGGGGRGNRRRRRCRRFD